MEPTLDFAVRGELLVHEFHLLNSRSAVFLTAKDIEFHHVQFEAFRMGLESDFDLGKGVSGFGAAHQGLDDDSPRGENLGRCDQKLAGLYQRILNSDFVVGGDGGIEIESDADAACTWHVGRGGESHIGITGSKVSILRNERDFGEREVGFDVVGEPVTDGGILGAGGVHVFDAVVERSERAAGIDALLVEIERLKVGIARSVVVMRLLERRALLDQIGSLVSAGFA